MKVSDINSSPAVEIQMTTPNREAWDGFENQNIRTALDKILRCKMTAKLDASSQKGQLQYEGCLDANGKADGHVILKNLLSSHCFQLSNET